MKWRVTMAAVLGIVAIPVPAQAASVDVVAAVRRLQAQGSPVKIFQHTSLAWPRDPRLDDMPRVNARAGTATPT
ncbi:hypothetical protein [Microbispora bryophytorum]|uniref:hypothetical protein n=1 Tax=Microbispora bryophytorum TaxID=1460882 RepID=UPI0033DD1759